MMDAIKTGALIAQTRKEKGLTQRELAERVYVSVQAVSKWEKGKNFPDLSLMEPLAEELGLTVSELLAGERGEAPQDELVRDTLRIGVDQFKPQIRRWKGRFIAALVLLSLVILGSVGLWVQGHTRQPQRETVIEALELSEEEQTMIDLLNTQGGDYSYLHMYNVTVADEMEGFRIAAELWTHEGLEDSWDLFTGALSQEEKNGSNRQLLAFRIPIGQGEGARYKVQFGGTAVTGYADIFDSVLPYLANGFVLNYADRAIVDRERGAVLMEVALNEDREGFFAAQILGRSGDPQLLEGTAALVLKLYWN